MSRRRPSATLSSSSRRPPLAGKFAGNLELEEESVSIRRMRRRELHSQNGPLRVDYRRSNRASILIHRRRSDDFTWNRVSRSGPGPTQVRTLANFERNGLGAVQGLFESEFRSAGMILRYNERLLCVSRCIMTSRNNRRVINGTGSLGAGRKCYTCRYDARARARFFHLAGGTRRRHHGLFPFSRHRLIS